MAYRNFDENATFNPPSYSLPVTATFTYLFWGPTLATEVASSLQTQGDTNTSGGLIPPTRSPGRSANSRLLPNKRG